LDKRIYPLSWCHLQHIFPSKIILLFNSGNSDSFFHYINHYNSRIPVGLCQKHDFILRKMRDYLGSSSRKVQKAYNRIWTALRFTILITLTGDSSRELATRVSNSRLLKWFTAEEITDLIHILNQAVGNAEQARRLILVSEFDFPRHWVDNTCIKADIHLLSRLVTPTGCGPFPDR